MAKHDIYVSLNTYDEIVGALEAQGVRLAKDDPISIHKDIAIKAPVNYKQVQIRRDIIIEAVKVYKSPIDKNEYEVNNVQEFVDFCERIYQYVLTGDTRPATPNTNETIAKKSEWK